MEPIWTLGDVIVKLRDAFGIERETLAQWTSLSYSTITRLEQNKDTSTKSVTRVAKAFGLTSQTLYALVPPMPSVPALIAAFQDTDFVTFWKRWTALSDHTKETWLVCMTDIPADADAELTMLRVWRSAQPENRALALDVLRQVQAAKRDKARPVASGSRGTGPSTARTPQQPPKLHSKRVAQGR